MPPPFSLKKLKNKLNRSIPGLTYGFNDPKTWIDTGCYALNFLMANRFDGGIPLEGKFTMFAGDSGSGKSYIASANVIRYCQANGIWPIVVDTENALDKMWVDKLNVKTDEEHMTKLGGASIGAIAQGIDSIIDFYLEEHGEKPYEERPKMIIIDSIGMMITPTNAAQVADGELAGDMGIKAKMVTQMIRVLTSKIASQPIGLIGTNHVMESQDKYLPEKIPGGKMLEFASSIIVQMNKYMLKEDDNGKKITGGHVRGIRASSIVRKSRYAKPFERIQIDIPYDTGMNPYSGCYDLFRGLGLLELDGQSYSYTSRETGEIITAKRPDLITKGVYDKIIAEHHLWNTADDNIGFGETECPVEDQD